MAPAQRTRNPRDEELLRVTPPQVFGWLLSFFNDWMAA